MALVTFHAACHSSILCRPRPNSPPPLDESSSKLPSSMLKACGVFFVTPLPPSPFPSPVPTPPYDDSSELHVVRNGFVSGLPGAADCSRLLSASGPDEDGGAPPTVPAAAWSPRRFMTASVQGLFSGTYALTAAHTTFKAAPKGGT